MAKKLSDIQEIIETSGDRFYTYLRQNLSNDVLTLLMQISACAELYIFSGIIRNFFLNKSDIRDVDIVVDSKLNLEEFQISDLKTNSFGGHKFNVGDTKVDLWCLRETWGLKHQKVLDFDTLHHIVDQLPRTAFFNFSAILFSFSERKFHYSKDFMQFLQSKKMDVVFKPNANYQLCIVNSFYYADKYQLQLSNSLKKYIIELFKANYEDYEAVQKKHFGEILYSNAVVKDRIYKIFQSLPVVNSRRNPHHL